MSGAAVALAARKVRDKARAIAAAMLETRPEDLEWEKGRWFVKGDPTRGKTIQEIALGAHGTVALPEGIDGNLDAEVTYDPPNLTFPFGAYICVVDIDPGTGKVKVRRFVAVDDCGTRINPMIIEGQIHGGLADGVGMALMEFIGFDEQGNCLGGSFMDYLIPTAMEVPDWETGYTVTPVAAPPDRRQGHRGVGDRRVAAGRRQRRRRRAGAVRRDPHGHAVHAGPGVGGHAGPAHPADLRRAMSVTDTAAELTRTREPFVQATVVRAQKPTSAHAGDTALVRADGSIAGFVGGTCAEARCASTA